MRTCPQCCLFKLHCIRQLVLDGTVLHMHVQSTWHTPSRPERNCPPHCLFKLHCYANATWRDLSSTLPVQTTLHTPAHPGRTRPPECLFKLQCICHLTFGRHPMAPRGSHGGSPTHILHPPSSINPCDSCPDRICREVHVNPLSTCIWITSIYAQTGFFCLAMKMGAPARWHAAGNVTQCKRTHIHKRRYT